MKILIHQAQDTEEMHEKLAAYLAKYGNPAIFQTQKN